MRIEQTVMLQALEWSYSKARDGAGPFESAYQLAQKQLEGASSRAAAVENIINWQVTKCATSGFITGLGGLLTLPLAIPVNISSVLLFQLRMILCIALLRGFDPRSERVRSMAFLCLTGSSASRILNEAGVDASGGIREQTMQCISEQVMRRINHLVKIRLLTKTGGIGILKLGKAIPLIGGVIGGTLDASATKEIGRAAKRLFVAPTPIQKEPSGW